MKRLKKYIITSILILLVSVLRISAQETDPESLLQSFDRTRNDSVKCQILKVLFSVETDPNKRLDYNKRREAISLQNIKLNKNAGLKNYYIKNLAAVYNNYGVLYGLIGDHDRSIESYKKSIQIKEGELKDTLSAQSSQMSIAYIYKSIGMMDKALEIMNKSLKVCRHYRDISGESNALNNMATVYSFVGENLKAIEYEKIALDVISGSDDYKRKAEILNNIGVFYYDLNNTDSASFYWNKVLQLYEKFDDRAGLANILSNIGITYKLKGDFNNAEKHYLKGEQIYTTLPDKRNYPILLIDLSELYILKKDLPKALEKAKKAEQLLEMQGSIYETSNVYYLLYDLYKKLNDSKQSLVYFEKYILLNDSLKSENNRKSAIRSQLKYEYEKQAAADSVSRAKETDIKNAELTRQKAELNAKKIQQYALFGGLFVVCVFGVFMYNRFKVTQKQKTIIEQQKGVVEEQKKLVEEKQKEILDSIHYAKRIQLAQIPSEKRVKLMIDRLKHWK